MLVFGRVLIYNTSAVRYSDNMPILQLLILNHLCLILNHLDGDDFSLYQS